MFRGGCVCWRTLGRLSADECNCVPTLLVIWPKVFKHWSLQAVWWGQVTLMIIPWGLCHQCSCPHTEPKTTLPSPGDPPRCTVRSSPDSYGIPDFPWDSEHMKPSLHPTRVESLFPWVLGSSFTQDPKPNCLGAPPSDARTPCWGIWCGAQNSHSCEITSVIQLFFSLFSPTWWVWDLLISQKCPSSHLILASSLSLGVENLFWYFPVFLSMVVQQLVVILVFS